MNQQKNQNISQIHPRTFQWRYRNICFKIVIPWLGPLTDNSC